MNRLESPLSSRAQVLQGQGGFLSFLFQRIQSLMGKPGGLFQRICAPTILLCLSTFSPNDLPRKGRQGLSLAAFSFLELLVRIELTTPSLRVTCSTFEPQQQTSLAFHCNACLKDKLQNITICFKNTPCRVLQGEANPTEADFTPIQEEICLRSFLRKSLIFRCI